MKKILIIVGHQNIKFNSIVSLRGNTGTDGELEANLRIGNRVSAMCRERGIEVIQTDANVNDDKNIINQDFDLALALHCDMNVAGDAGGGMVGSGDSSVDNSWQESLRIKKIFDEIYFTEVKIINKNIVTAGMAKYYVWRYLSSKTPCVLLEMGQIKDAHDSVLLANTDLIATGIVKSICKAIGVSYEITQQITTDTIDYKKENIELKSQLEMANKSLKQRIEDFPYSLADLNNKCQENKISYNKKIINFINSI